jgi:hypothetical protein
MRGSSNAHQGASKSDASKDPARLNHERLPELAEAAGIAGRAYIRRIPGAQVGQSRDAP